MKFVVHGWGTFDLAGFKVSGAVGFSGNMIFKTLLLLHLFLSTNFLYVFLMTVPTKFFSWDLEILSWKKMKNLKS